MTSGSTGSITGLSFGHAGSDYPYVVLVGHVGTGKSTIVKKLAHPESLSDVSNKSVTRSSQPFWTYDGSMVICDTPGTNPEAAEADFFRHNVHVAAAITFQPVSRILIVVKAEFVMNTVFDKIEEYSKNLLPLTDYSIIVGVIVTHMDAIISWSPEDLKSLVVVEKRDDLGLNCILFSGKDTSRGALLEQILTHCSETVCMDAYHRDFGKLFELPIWNNSKKILREMNYRVQQFKGKKQQFDIARKTYKENEEMDLIFEFQTWIEGKIEIAQNIWAEKLRNNFSFYGDGAEMEVGLITTMNNQIRLILFDLRLEIAKCHIEREVDARRCPYCNEVWTKDHVEGCEGSAICGDNPSPIIDTYRRHVDELGTYTFKWHYISKKLFITSTTAAAKRTSYSTFKSFGCGRLIMWQNMSQVDLPEDLCKSLYMTDSVTKPNDREPNVIPTENLEPKPGTWNSDNNYVVMIGDVGGGKSTVVKKLTNAKVKKGDSAFSVTRSSTPHCTYDGSMVVCDTPGSNSIEDQLKHNEHIAAALNYKPVSRILIIVKADTRIANVMSVVSRYNARLLSLPDDIVGVLVTHMDTVSWSPEDLKPRMKDEFDMECVLFSGKDTPKETLLANIKAVCIKIVSVRVDDTNFSKLFKIHNSMVKILRETTKEVDTIKDMKTQFDELTKAYDDTAKAALILQFESWMGSQISEAKRRLELSNNFTFSGDDAAKEKGYIVNMTSQMKVVLHSLLNEAKYFREHEANIGLRRFTFKWQNRKLSVKAVKAKSHQWQKSSMASNGMSVSESSYIYDQRSDFQTVTRSTRALNLTNSAKNQILSPSKPYYDKRNDLEPQYGRNSVEKDIDRRPILTITKKEPSGANKFSFDVEDQIYNAGSSKLGNTVDSSFPLSRKSAGGEKEEDDFSTEKINLEVEKGNSDGDEMNETATPFSFKINFNLSLLGLGRYSYIFKWQNGGLMMEPSGTKTMSVAENDMSTKANDRGELVPQVDGPQDEESWRNISVNIEEVSSGIPEFQTKASSTDCKSSNGIQEVKQISKSNVKPYHQEPPTTSSKSDNRDLTSHEQHYGPNKSKKWKNKRSSKQNVEKGYLNGKKDANTQTDANQCLYYYHHVDKSSDTDPESPKLSITFTPSQTPNPTLSPGQPVKDEQDPSSDRKKKKAKK